MWKLVKGEFKYARKFLIPILAFMVICGYLKSLVYPLKPESFFGIIPVIFGLCVLMSWLMVLKQEKRDVLIASLPVSSTGFAMFRIVTPLIWYGFVIAYYLIVNQIVTGNKSIDSIIYGSLLWPIFHIGYSITSDFFIKLTAKPFSTSKARFGILLTIAGLSAIIYGSFTLAGWLFPNLQDSDLFEFFVYLVLFIVLSAVSVFTYGRRTRFV